MIRASGKAMHDFFVPFPCFMSGVHSYVKLTATAATSKPNWRMENYFRVVVEKVQEIPAQSTSMQERYSNMIG